MSIEAMSIKAMKQALEALEQHLTHHEHGCVYLDPAVTALRQALENHESAYQRGYLDGMAKPCIDCADRKLQAMKQPKQDSVEWERELLNLLCRIHRDGGHYIAEHGIRKALDDADLRVAKLNAINDTAPQPKREWVGLTDEEIAEMTCHESLIRYFEAKLREKNT